MAPEGLIEVRVSWPEHPHYLKKKNSGNKRDHYQLPVLWVFFKIPTLEYFVGELDKFMW